MTDYENEYFKTMAARRWRRSVKRRSDRFPTTRLRAQAGAARGKKSRLRVVDDDEQLVDLISSDEEHANDEIVRQKRKRLGEVVPAPAKRRDLRRGQDEATNEVDEATEEDEHGVMEEDRIWTQEQQKGENEIESGVGSSSENIDVDISEAEGEGLNDDDDADDDTSIHDDDSDVPNNKNNQVDDQGDGWDDSWRMMQDFRYY